MPARMKHSHPNPTQISVFVRDAEAGIRVIPQQDIIEFAMSSLRILYEYQVCRSMLSPRLETAPETAVRSI